MAVPPSIPPEIENILEIVFKVFLEKGWELVVTKGPEVIRKGKDLFNKGQKGIITRSCMVNRFEEISEIDHALTDTSRSRVFYFWGKGGIGKTRLLEEVEHRVLKKNGDVHFLWSGIIDLYHTEFHDIQSLQKEIVYRLDPEIRYFKLYIEKLEKYHISRRQRLSFSDYSEIETLNQLFLSSYNKLAQDYRLVIAFDTLESLDYAIHPNSILSSTPYPSQDIVSSWLFRWLSDITNSVVLLAGRPQPHLRDLLGKITLHEGILCECREIQPLFYKDRCTLIKNFQGNKNKKLQLRNTMVEQLAQYNITPVELALVMEISLNGLGLDGIEINGLEEEKNNIQKKLIENFFNNPTPQSRVFFYIAQARKGLNAKTLAAIQNDWNEKECVANLKKIDHLSIIKSREGSKVTSDAHKEYYFHDAMYELYDLFFNLEAENRYLCYQKLREYYLREQNIVEKESRERIYWAYAAQKLLYYELHCQPIEAFYRYMQWAETTIKGNEFELEMLLRSELLKFMDKPQNKIFAQKNNLTIDMIQRDQFVRMIKRLSTADHWNEASDQAEKVLLNSRYRYLVFSECTSSNEDIRSSNSLPTKTKDPLFWGELLSSYGESLVYKGASSTNVTHTKDKAISKIFQEADNLLSKRETNESIFRSQARERALGWTHDRLGYYFRTDGHYGKAEAEYREALRHYQIVGDEYEKATTMTNLSFVLAQMGKVDEALDVIRSAYDIRVSLDQKYPLALTQNTKGIISGLNKQYQEAINSCLEALKLFKDLDASRGIGLAYNALGYIGRLWANEWKDRSIDSPLVRKLFNDSFSYLDEAKKIFTSDVKEYIRLWEACNESGSLLYDWGVYLCELGDLDEGRNKLNEAVKYFEKALKIAREHQMDFYEADTLDDLAQTYVLLGDYGLAYHNLSQSMRFIPKEAVECLNTTNNNKSKGEAYWLILGKVFFHQGLWQMEECFRASILNETKIKESIHLIVSGAVALKHFSGTDEFLVVNQFDVNRLCARNLRSIFSDHLSWLKAEEIDLLYRMGFNV